MNPEDILLQEYSKAPDAESRTLITLLKKEKRVLLVGLPMVGKSEFFNYSFSKRGYVKHFFDFIYYIDPKKEKKLEDFRKGLKNRLEIDFSIRPENPLRSILSTERSKTMCLFIDETNLLLTDKDCLELKQYLNPFFFRPPENLYLVFVAHPSKEEKLKDIFSIKDSAVFVLKPLCYEDVKSICSGFRIHDDEEIKLVYSLSGGFPFLVHRVISRIGTLMNQGKKDDEIKKICDEEKKRIAFIFRYLKSGGEEDWVLHQLYSFLREGSIDEKLRKRCFRFGLMEEREGKTIFTSEILEKYILRQ